MSETVQSNDPEAQKRRSTRIAQSIPITVMGVDALGQAFKERTTTVSVNCHGCKYQSKHYVPKASQLTIEIARAEGDAPPRVVEGRVAWVQRPRTVRELFQIGVEFVVPGNVWGIAFPPADWFPLPHEPEIEIPISAKEPEAKAVEPAASNEAGLATTESAESEPIPAPSAATASPSPPAESKVRVLPSPAQAQETMSMARQMARLLAEAKQHLNRTMQSGAAEAVAQEVRTAREEVESRLRATVHEAVEASVAKSAQQSVEKAVESAVQGSLKQLVEHATQQVVQNALAAFEKARQAATPAPAELEKQVRTAVEQVVETSAAKLAEQTIQQSVKQTVDQAVKHSVQQALAKATANLPAAAKSSGAPPSSVEAMRQLEEAAQARIANWRKEIEAEAEKLQSQSVNRLHADSDAATRRWQEQFESALAGASSQMNEQLNQISLAAVTRAEEEISSRNSSLQNLLNEAASEAQKNLEGLCSNLAQERTRAESAVGRADEAVRRAEEASQQMEAMSKAALDMTRQQMDGLVASQSEELARRAEEVVRSKAGEIEKPVQEAADAAMRQVAERVEQQLAPQYERARQASEQLEASARHAEDALSQFREKMHELSEQALAKSLERMRAQTAEFPEEFEQTCRAALTKVEEELESKSTETTHATFEALFKASEWYQKKAQTSMQTALEKMLEQSTGGMRERAAELSRMFASELDHYSRNYVEHAQGMMEESAREIRQRTGEQMQETAKTVAAGLSDDLHRITAESLARFEATAKVSNEQAQANMKEGTEKALDEFDSRLEERMVQGATQARRHLEEQLKPLVEAFYAKREAEQQAWLEQMKGVVENSIEQYKERLENTSNSWLLASATTLGQHSKAVLETLSGAAEERLKDTCADVFAGLGETLRDRLLGISSDVGAAKKPPEKK